MSADIDIGNLIKKGFQTYIHDIGFVLLYLIPVLLLIVFAIGFVFMIGFDVITMYTTAMQNPLEAQSTMTAMFSSLQGKLPLLIGTGIIFGILYFITSIAAYAGIIKKLDAHEKGQEIDVMTAFTSGLHYVPSIFLGGLILMLPIMALVGLIAFATVINAPAVICISTFILVITIIVYFYLIFRLVFFPQACVLENLGALESLHRSWDLTKGNVILIFVTYLILGIIAFIFMIPILVIQQIAPSLFFISLLGNQIIALIYGPIMVIVLTLFYMKLSGKKQQLTPEQTINIPSQNLN